jgi:hypothetical protein
MFLRALLAFLALPGIVAFAIPIYWLISTSRTDLEQPLGLLPLLLGCAGLFWCVRDFYVFGKGTLAPWSPPERLVTAGLYRYSRNPMYVSVVLILLGWAVSFGARACIGTRSSWASRFMFASSWPKSRGCAARTRQHGMTTCVACAVGCNETRYRRTASLARHTGQRGLLCGLSSNSESLATSGQPSTRATGRYLSSSRST